MNNKAYAACYGLINSIPFLPEMNNLTYSLLMDKKDPKVYADSPEGRLKNADIQSEGWCTKGEVIGDIAQIVAPFAWSKLSKAGKITKGVSKVDETTKVASKAGKITEGGSKSADLGNKLDYIFGKGTGNKHNIQRSQSMQIELEKIGIYDDLSGRDYLTQHLNKVLNDSSNISSLEDRSYVAKEIAGNPTIEYTATTRESLLMGPYGGVKLKTIWDGDRLLTIIIEGGH
ncbi:hypothetical protein [Lachnobacterium bovis]|uniref:hypothetical protein n=1 Tax=Lachnobacterium bovis TaxID=140626 RepID=UPI0018659582|nr:hypothetical protein [Lachnobacterium bovis]